MKIDFGNFKLTKKRFVIIAISIGILQAILLFYYYPSREVRNIYINNIIQVKGASVDKILIEPYENTTYKTAILKQHFYIKDKKEILKFCKLINKSTKYIPNHPDSKWNCVVTMWMREKQITFRVYQTYTKGFYINISSDVTSGWFYASYRNEELGKFINELIVRANKNN